jgi:D-alanyl-D-alanine carboxypeptidase
MIDEIPEAIRENIEVKEPSRSPWAAIVIGVLGLGIIGLLSIFFFSSPTKQSQTLPKAETSPPVESKQSPAEVEQPETVTPEEPKTEVKRENLLGHLPYEEASQSELEAITADGRIQLRAAAAAKFKQMQAAAAAEGVILTPISGFRSVKAQEQLFFDVKEQRVQNATKRAEVSAPPGYSEHHTGYALDIGDGKVPATDVNPEFADTAAFQWLQNNAARYSFELSFPPNNAQGINYEPWHWRFVGDRDSLETFYKARN